MLKRKKLISIIIFKQDCTKLTELTTYFQSQRPLRRFVIHQFILQIPLKSKAALIVQPWYDTI